MYHAGDCISGVSVICLIARQHAWCFLEGPKWQAPRCAGGPKLTCTLNSYMQTALVPLSKQLIERVRKTATNSHLED